MREIRSSRLFVFIMISNGAHQIKCNIYMQVMFKLHCSMTGSVASERRHAKYVSGGGGAPNCVLFPGADNPHYATCSRHRNSVKQLQYRKR